MTAAQTRELLQAAAGDDHEALYVLAFATGMRQGELLGLRWQDIDWEVGRIHVRHSLVRMMGTWDLAEPKTSRSRRSIRIGGSTVTALRAHRGRQLEQRLAAGAGWTDHDFTFTDTRGEPLDGRNVTKAFGRLLEREGMPHLRFHDLRHTAASLLLARGTHPKVVQEILGHSTIALTLDVYSHVVPTMHDDAAATMDAVLTG